MPRMRTLTTFAALATVLIATGGCTDTEKQPSASAGESASDPCAAVLTFRASASDPVRGLAKQGAQAIPVLVYLMTGEDTATAIAAAEEAVRIGIVAVPALTSLLRSKSPRGRGWAAWALGELGPAAKEAREALKAAQSDPELRVAAGEALRKIGE
jgi:HEAT repeat protein